MSETINVEAIFGENVFNDSVMKERLPKSVYKKLKQTIEDGSELDPTIADVVAHAMKDWAVDNGATHYTHWFQPLTGVTAEKHDSFIGNFDSQGKVLMDLSGKELIKGETDGSSFPSGGLRATFEARGYTAWDCTSAAFLKKDATGVTLCIPTAFCSYRGEALDKKTPLLRSMQAIDKEATRIFHLFGHTEVKRVTPSVGPEQEYFLIDRDKYLKRKDLIYTGRTLFGAMPPKGQEMDDHYYGVIRERIGSYMKELNEELWKLGVTAKTQHNEVAPAQHELATIYTKANLAVDHNQIVMETMKKVANRHGMACLLHEKPFQGVNGSGKHNNWSLASDTGINMLDPGVTPHENIQFLLVLACIMKAVDRHADLLRQSAAVPGNDFRLGAQEAPPAIISIFVGEQLEDVIDQLISTGSATHSKTGGTLKTGVTTLPDFDKDATDRNRTSPFAFTGNKFEFRMVGSSDSVSSANVVLNTIVAEAFKEAADELEKAEDFDLAVHDMIKKLLADHRRIIFNGNGYSEAWEVEAERRGLPNRKCTPDAMIALKDEKNIALMEEFGVLTKTEMLSRYEVEMEHYSKILNIEARTMLKIANKQLIPAATAYMGEVAGAAAAKTAAVEGISTKAETKVLTALSKYTDEMSDATDALQAATDKVSAMDDEAAKAHAFHDEVIPAMDALRAAADEAESIVDEDYWPLPCYSRMLFYTE